MQTLKFISILLLTTLVSCSESTEAELTSFAVFCEMVANDAKPIALSHPMTPKEMDKQWPHMLQIADEYGVSIFREDDFPITALFPKAATIGKSVALVYQGDRLTQYMQLKNDVAGSRSSNDQLALSRRFGRLLGYSPVGINGLLQKNTEFKSLAAFGVEKQITHLYYNDPETAVRFYEQTLGLSQVSPLVFSVSDDAFLAIHSHDERHPLDQPQSTAIALLTDQLPSWYAHLQSNGVTIKYTYKPKEGGAHDGFVAVDPGGYLLEFEQFKQHPENELFVAILAGADRQMTSVDTLSFYGSITWTYHKDLLKVKNYYEQELGFRMVADQGWTKIFQTSNSGFIGLVDERRGMMDYADDKAVEIEWQFDRVEKLYQYLNENGSSWDAESFTMQGPENYQFQLK
ncbi:MAG: catechol 2,3-dioxygenase-like lactoylglutathione lyase family enzyme [Paraglaciecola sp.]|jgi:catechol 2,3-dioxygenase-like lactoylglutathione lyase family enzyme